MKFVVGETESDQRVHIEEIGHIREAGDQPSFSQSSFAQSLLLQSSFSQSLFAQFSFSLSKAGSGKICQDLGNFSAAQFWRIRTRAQDRKASHRILHDASLAGTLRVRRQDNAASFDVGIQRVACAEAEAAAKRAGKNDLTFAGELGLHGKNILPLLKSLPKTKSRQLSLTA
jgi:hypothetical protein